jgi:hypothetical protein
MNRTYTRTFTLKITIGNEGMETLTDIANAVYAAARKLTEGKETSLILDANGNYVGSYEITEEED